MLGTDFSVDKRDILFTLFELLEVQTLANFSSFSDYDRETLEDFVEGFFHYAENELAPTNQPCDQEGLRFEKGQVFVPEGMKKALASLKELGFSGLRCSTEFGGAGLPNSVATVAHELFCGANTSFSLFATLSCGTGHLIEAFGSDELKQKYVERIYTSELGGTMCLTEPHAGSDVGDIHSTATPHGDHYLIKGTKIFITFGDHDLTENIVHAVLAKLPDAPQGTRGISLFIVPKLIEHADGTTTPNDMSCVSIEHKLGIHASPTCVLSFGENDQCVGYLLGEPNQGMKYMFQMMNEARLDVGIQGLSSGAAAYRSALGYALDRKQGSYYKDTSKGESPRAPIVLHPDIRRNLMIMKSYVEGIRALSYSVSLYLDQSHCSESEEKREYYLDLVELLIPICKAYSTDKGFKITELAMQVYGGAGYTQDYPVEQYLRDVKIASIYEGTNGIQALDLVGRKLRQKKGARLQLFLSLVEEELALWKNLPPLRWLEEFKSAQTVFVNASMQLFSSSMSGDMDHVLLNATPYLEMFGNFATAFYLTKSARIALEALQKEYSTHGIATDEQKRAFHRKNSEANFYNGKVLSAQFFVQNILPENLGLAHCFSLKDSSALDILFEDEREIDFSF